MAKYSVRIEVINIEEQVIEVDAESTIEADSKIRKLMESESRCYSYLPVGGSENYKIESITKLG